MSAEVKKTRRRRRSGGATAKPANQRKDTTGWLEEAFRRAATEVPVHVLGGRSYAARTDMGR